MHRMVAFPPLAMLTCRSAKGPRVKALPLPRASDPAVNLRASDSSPSGQLTPESKDSRSSSLSPKASSPSPTQPLSPKDAPEHQLSPKPAWKAATRSTPAPPTLPAVAAAAEGDGVVVGSSPPAASSIGMLPLAVRTRAPRASSHSTSADEGTPTGECDSETDAPTRPRRWSFLEAEAGAIKEDDLAAQLYVWGGLDRKMLSAPVPQAFGALADCNVRNVVGGLDHFVLCTDAGLCYSWGNGSFGALGLGDTEDRKEPSLVEALGTQHVSWIAASKNQSAVVTDRGLLFLWGSSGSSQPGVDCVLLPQRKSELKGHTFAEVSLGEGFVVALLRDGTVLTWGDNSWGQLGSGSLAASTLTPCSVAFDEKIAHVYCGVDVAGAVSVRGTAYLWGQNWAKPTKPNRTPMRVASKVKVQQMAIGGRHVLLLSQGGVVFAMGENGRFQLGVTAAEDARSVPARVIFNGEGDSSGPASE